MIKMQSLFFPVFMIIVLGIAGCSRNTLELKTTQDHFEPKQGQTPLHVGLAVGSTPPDFEITTTANQQVRLHSFGEQQKPVLVYFMTTWCPYCAQDFTVLSSVYSEYENEVPIVVMSLDLSEDATVLMEYQQKYPTLEKVIFAPGKASILIDYSVRTTTTKYAIGRNGKILYAGSGAFTEAQWKILLEALRNS